MSEREKKSVDEVMNALKRDADFWKSQFMRLVDILIESKDLKDDIIKHIMK